MATTCTIDRLSGIYLKRISETFMRSVVSLGIPGGMGAAFATGGQLPTFSAEFAIHETTTALAKTKATQLKEIINNFEYRPIYITWSGDETPLDGWYMVSDLRFEVAREFANVRPFTMTLQRIGGISDYRIYTLWSAAAETYSGANWTGALTANKLIALPYNVTSPDFTVTETRTTIDGSNQVLLNPTRAYITYKQSATVADWWLAECRVYDSVSAGDTTEANWVQVYSPTHTFTGDCIIQNGMVRYKIGAVADYGTSFYVLDTVATPDAWVDGGALRVYNTGAADWTKVYHYEITQLSPDIIRWREIRQDTTNTDIAECVMQRGARHIKVKLTSGASGIDTAHYVRLFGTNYYDEFFNESANGSVGGGSLATDADSNYHCAYNTTRDIVVGFALTVQPANQPNIPADNDVFAESNTWGASETITFFIFGFSQETSAFNLTTARATADAIAAQCLWAIEQETRIMPRGWYV